MEETVYRCVCGNMFDNWQDRDACAESGHGIMEREPLCPACALKDASIAALESALTLAQTARYEHSVAETGRTEYIERENTRLRSRLSALEGEVCKAKEAATLAITHLHAQNDVKERVREKAVFLLSTLAPCPHASRLQQVEAERDALSIHAQELSDIISESASVTWAQAEFVEFALAWERKASNAIQRLALRHRAAGKGEGT